MKESRVARMSNRSPLVWLVMVAGLIIGAMFTVIGLLLLDDGPQLLIVGLIFLAFGGVAFFTRQRSA